MIPRTTLIRAYSAAALLLCASAASAQQFVISTVAGAPPLATVPVPALSVSIGRAESLATDQAGNVYFTYLGDVPTNFGYSVLKLDPNGILTRVTGYPEPGFSGDGGPAITAEFYNLAGLATDSSGNLYLADKDNGRVRKISLGGLITTVAGGGSDTGDGGPATAAALRLPSLLAVDSDGNLYIATYIEGGGTVVRMVSVNGTITTVAGNGSTGYSGDGGPATSAQIGQLGGLAVDQAGNLYLSDNLVLGDDDSDYVVSARVRRVSGGIITTVAGSDAVGYSGDGGPGAAAELGYAGPLAFDGAGNLYVVDSYLSYLVATPRIRKIAVDGTISTFAGNGIARYSGDGGPATAASLAGPTALGIDNKGNLLVADYQRVRKVSSDGIITTVAGNGVLCCDVNGVPLVSGDGGPATQAVLHSPIGIAVDGSGAMYISDTYDYRVRKVTPDGTISTIATNGSPYGAGATLYGFLPAGVALDGTGNLYVADAGNMRISSISPSGAITTIAGSHDYAAFGGDGGPATSALLSWPKDVALDASGNVYIADSGNNRIRMVTPAGIISTFAGSGATAGSGAANYGGDGGAATNARLNVPTGVAVDNAGNVYVSDTNNYRIRKISSTGIITTIAGIGTRGYSGDGGLAVNAQLNEPLGIKVDKAGGIYIADGTSVRRISTDGLIATVAGNGILGYTGDGGPATSAQLGAWGLAIDSAGDLYVADQWTNNIRLLQAK